MVRKSGSRALQLMRQKVEAPKLSDSDPGLSCLVGPLHPQDQTAPIAGDFGQAIINSLISNICVIDKSGRIIAVNTAWSNYATQNSAGSPISFSDLNYLDVCTSSSGEYSEEASQFEAGVRAVLNGTLEIYECEYPCHAPWEDRWFLGRVTPLRYPGGGAVIEHVNITAHKAVAEKLRKEALTDVLTQLPNRRYFMDVGARELARVKRFKVPATVLIFDVDHFKAINDSHGHAGGDVALQILSKACVDLLRTIDTIARIGGEEFAVILTATDEIGARSIAERLRDTIATLRIPYGSTWICMTASVGIAQVRVDDTNIADALARADAALYAAKAAGRNRVESSKVA